MSKETSLLRGITHPDLKNAVSEAFKRGWEFDRMSGTTHAYLVWPATGKKVSFGTTPKDRNAHKPFIKKLELAMGTDLFPKHKTGRSRKNGQTSGFLDTYRPTHQDAIAERIDALVAEHHNLTLQFMVLSKQPVRHQDINDAAKVLRRISEIEKVLTELHQPFKSFIN